MDHVDRIEGQFSGEIIEILVFFPPQGPSSIDVVFFIIDLGIVHVSRPLLPDPR